MLRRPFGRRPSRARILALVSLMAVGQTACAETSDQLTALDPPAADARAKTTTTVEVLNPTEGAHVSGTQVFQARIPGVNLSGYSMTWQVGTGAENPMSSGTAYKQATVDVSSWTWNGSGPYAVTFRTKGGGNNAEKTVSIYVDQPSGGPSEPPPPSSTDNPIAGALFWVDPYSNAQKTADAWRSSRPVDAAAMDLIAQQAQADWFGEWSGDIRSAVSARAGTILGAGGTPVFVAYNIPVRDCNSYSGGGATSASAYRSWITAFAEGIGGRRVIVILEPDALAGMDCLDSTKRSERVALLKDAVTILESKGGLVYLDGGHARWQSASVMASRLTSAGVQNAHGFSLNVSNFITDTESAGYGAQVSSLLGGAHFVIDSSRNGLGPDGTNWCNPSGRALGHPPTTATGVAKLDAYLWIKRPGESDGTCNGGPAAGTWWAEYALGLAQRAPWAP
jgi:endoglucanase